MQTFKMIKLPINQFDTGRQEFWNTIYEHFYKKKDYISILEIGVFKGKMLLTIPDNIRPFINKYTGVDPYYGKNGDAYLGSYWSNFDESMSVYNETKAIFDKNNAELIRLNSMEYFYSHKEKYDVIFVDADHRFEQALWDMCKYYELVTDGGLLIIDDYSNICATDVTRAANLFTCVMRNEIKDIFYSDNTYLNRNKIIPLVSRYVYFEKKAADDYSELFLSYNNESGAAIGKVKYLDMTQKKKTAIWGYGKIGKNVFPALKNHIDFIIDSNPELFNKNIEGKIIRNPNELSYEELKDVYIIISLANYKEVENKLISMGKELIKDYYII